VREYSLNGKWKIMRRHGRDRPSYMYLRGSPHLAANLRYTRDALAIAYSDFKHLNIGTHILANTVIPKKKHLKPSRWCQRYVQGK